MSIINAITTNHQTLPIVLGAEDPKAYFALQTAVTEDLQPIGVIEHMYAGRVADLMWELERLKRQKAYLLAEPQRTYEQGKAFTESEVQEYLQEWWDDDFEIWNLTKKEEMHALSFESIPWHLERYQMIESALVTFESIYNKGKLNGKADVIDGYGAWEATLEIAEMAHLEFISEDCETLWVPGEDARFDHLDGPEVYGSGWDVGRVKRFLAFARENGRINVRASNWRDYLVTHVLNEYRHREGDILKLANAIEEKREELEREHKSHLNELLASRNATFCIKDKTLEFNLDQKERRLLSDIEEAMTRLDALKAKRQPTTPLPTITISPIMELEG